MKTTLLQPLTALTAILLAALSILTAPAPTVAQDAVESRPLREKAEISAVNTSGNSDVLTLSLKNRLEYDFSETVTAIWNLSVLYGEQDGIKNAERYTTDLRLDDDLSATTYVYVRGGWLRDRFSGFDNRYSAGPGIGRRFLSGSRHFLKAEVGLNWAWEDYVEGESEDFLEGRAYAQYDFVIAEGNAFVQSVEFLQDFKDGDNYKIVSVSAVTAALTRLLAIKIAYEVRYQNRPVPETLERTDTELSASLVVSY